MTSRKRGSHFAVDLFNVETMACARDRNFPTGGDDVLNQQIDLVRIAKKEYDLGPAQCQDASSSSTIVGVISDDGTNIPTLGDHQ
jgi:hypothetical protein